MHIVGGPEGEEQRGSEIIREIMAKNFQNMRKEMDTQI